jgi:hypothetical protein
MVITGRCTHPDGLKGQLAVSAGLSGHPISYETRIDFAHTSRSVDSKVIWCSRELPRSAIKSSHSYHHNLRTCGSCRCGPSVPHT